VRLQPSGAWQIAGPQEEGEVEPGQASLGRISGRQDLPLTLVVLGIDGRHDNGEVPVIPSQDDGAARQLHRIFVQDAAVVVSDCDPGRGALLAHDDRGWSAGRMR